MFDRAHQLAGLRIVFADRVLPEVREPLAVDVHAVPLRRGERPDQVALLVEVEHGRRQCAAIGNGRIELCLVLAIREAVRSIVRPDRVIRSDGQPGDAAHLPLVRQRLGPARIEPVARRGRRLRDDGHPQAEGEACGHGDDLSHIHWKPPLK